MTPTFGHGRLTPRCSSDARRGARSQRAAITVPSVPTQSRRPVRAFFGLDGRLFATYDDLSRTAVILLVLWAAGAIVFGAVEVVHDAVPFTGSDSSLNVLGSLSFLAISAFVLGLNILLAALVVGLVSIVRSGPRKVLRASLYVALPVVGVVATFALSGWSVSTSSDNESETPAPTSHPNHFARGLAIWAIAVGVVLLSGRVLRMGSETVSGAQADDAVASERGFHRRVVATRLVVVVLGVAALFGWTQVLDRPWVKVVNDGTDVVEVQYCPGQVCAGRVYRLNPGQQHRITLGSSSRDGFVSDSFRITSGATLLGCLPVLRVPDSPRHVEVGVSLADPRSC